MTRRRPNTGHLSGLILGLMALVTVSGCTTNKGGDCPPPDEAISWHFYNDTFHSWCAACDSSLSDEELQIRAESLGWEGIEPNQMTPCLFVTAETDTGCRQKVCVEGNHNGAVMTTDVRIWEYISRRLNR